MTTWRMPTDVEGSDERTVIDPRGQPPSTRPPPSQVPWMSLRPDRSTLGFICLGIAFVLVSVVAIGEHREAKALREALRTFETHRRIDSRRVNSVQVGVSGEASPESPPTPALAVDDRFRTERQATDFIVANDYEGALGQFDLLLNAFPDDRVYSDFVIALRWRLRCGHRRSVGSYRCN